MYNLTGEIFGRLTVIRKTTNIGKCTRWECRCDCGNISCIRTDSLVSGRTKSCGCITKEATIKRNMTHGKSDSRLYNIWILMKRRCNNPKDAGYHNYGGRGISICNQWDKYELFEEWALNNGYSDNLTIERSEVNGNYCPENCSWITPSEQARNMRKSVRIKVDGQVKNLLNYLDENGMVRDRNTIMSRIFKQGLTPEEALIKPIKRIGNRSVSLHV